MAKIQARNVDDELFERIEQAAMKNERSLEGEIRYALKEYYSPLDKGSMLSWRERWLQEMGERLKWSINQLLLDGYFGVSNRNSSIDVISVARVANQLNVSPGTLMDIIDGNQEMTTNLVNDYSQQFEINRDWLLAGTDLPFKVVSIGSTYQKFFSPENSNKYIFEFHRINKGRFDGTLFVLRQDKEQQLISLGVVTEQFKLAKGMGSGGHGNLKRFLKFIKSQDVSFTSNTFDWESKPEDTDFWSIFGQHHPIWFQNLERRRSANWLQLLLNGEDPDNWFDGWSSDLKDIANIPYGSDN